MIRLPFGSTPANQFHSRKTFFFSWRVYHWNRINMIRAAPALQLMSILFAPTHSPYPTSTPQREYLLTCVYCKCFLCWRGKYFTSIHHFSNKVNRQEFTEIDLLITCAGSIFTAQYRVCRCSSWVSDRRCICEVSEDKKQVILGAKIIWLLQFFGTL